MGDAKRSKGPSPSLIGRLLPYRHQPIDNQRVQHGADFTATRPSPQSSVFSSIGRQGGGSFYTPTNPNSFSYFPPNSEDPSPERASTPGVGSDGGKVRWSLRRLTKQGKSSDSSLTMDTHTGPKGCLACFKAPFQSLRKASSSSGSSGGGGGGGPHLLLGPQDSSRADAGAVLGVDGVDVTLFNSNNSSSSRRGGMGMGMGLEGSSLVSHRSSGSDSNSEFWDAVEMLDDAVLDDDSCIESVTSMGGEGGQGPVIRIELLSRHYDIPLVGTTGQLPVSFLLTETLRRYAGIRVFAESEGLSLGTGSYSSPASLRQSSDVSLGMGVGGEGDLQRLLQQCKGLVNKNTGEVFGMSSVLSYEALIAHSYAVLLSAPPPHDPSSSSSPLLTGDADPSPNHKQTYPPLGAAGVCGSPSLALGNVCGPKAIFPSTAVPRFPGPAGDGNNCWSQPDGREFQVRGLTYMADKVKVSSLQAAYNLLGVDLLLSDTKRSHVSRESQSFVSRARRPPCSSSSFLFVMNFALPWGSFIAYFGPAHEGPSPYVGDTKLDALLQRFLEGDDDFRNQRLKVIPRCVEGPWPVKAAVGTTPAIMGTKITHTYYRQHTHNCFEIEVDITSSVAAQYILSVVKSFTHMVAVDLAFVLQGECESELPERVLFAVRFHHLNVLKALTYSQWEDTLHANPPTHAPHTTAL